LSYNKITVITVAVIADRTVSILYAI